MKWQKIWNCGLNGFLGGILISNYKTSINNLFTTFLYIKSIFLNVWDISFLKITELKNTQYDTPPSEKDCNDRGI